jgi:formylmethanofuran dehydrogenase subunit C
VFHFPKSEFFMALRLVQTTSTTIPLEVEGLTPDWARDKTLAQVQRFEVFHGNTKVPLAEFFQVEGDPSDETIAFEGDLAGVHWIGAKMSQGAIRVCGNAGRHVGSMMRGGAIQITGDVGDWLGGEMHGGLIQVHGCAGHQVGAAYRGSARGMTKGTILVHGSAGNEIGHTMRRGLIAIGGGAGDLIGFNMLAGTILVCGEAGIRHGAGMRRGTIGLFGLPHPPLLPSFRRACRNRPEVLSLIWRELSRLGFPVSDELRQCTCDLYNGDLIEGGRGEILLRAV